MICIHFPVTSLKRNMQIFQWCFMTLVIIESIAAEVQTKNTSLLWDKLISGHGILGDEMLIAINNLSLYSETLDDQVILYDAPLSADEDIKDDNQNVKGSTENQEPLLTILPPNKFNKQNVQTTAVRKGNRIPKQTEISNGQQQQQQQQSNSNPIYKPVQEPSHGYLPKLQPESKPSISSYQPQTVIPAPEPRIISGDTYISKELPEPIEVPILGSILKPNKYLPSNPVSQLVTFPQSGLVRIPPPVLVPIVAPISQVNSAIFPLHFIRNKKSH